MGLKALLAATSLLLATGCSNIPQEVVDLSNVLGENMGAVHASHKQLIRQHFANIREQRLEYLNEVWVPYYLDRLIAKARLVEIASGKVVFDRETETFVTPTPGRAKVQLLDSVLAWSEEAVDTIEMKRKELIEPVDADEKELILSVDSAFETIFRGNAAITAHLNSLVKVQKAQDDVLKVLHMPDLRVQLNDQLVKAAEKSRLTFQEIQDLDKALEEVAPKVSDIKRKLRKKPKK
jgi:hypothetical protein